MTIYCRQFTDEYAECLPANNLFCFAIIKVSEFMKATTSLSHE